MRAPVEIELTEGERVNMDPVHPRDTLREDTSPALAASKTAGAGVCFVVPTYNEAPNIVPLLRRLTGLYTDPDAAFLVVDDESPDGTGRLVREFAAADGRVHLLEGPRRGFGQAYVRGMTYALETLGANAVVQMDADLSHDPADARRLLDRLADGADVAIGSRYVAGGSLDPRWHVGRRLLSRWGNRFARYIADIRGVRDCTSGFKAIRAEALEAARVRDIRVRGHTFQIVLLHRLIHAGARVVEEPIHFRDRERGQTKLGARSILEFFVTLWWLRLTGHRVLLRYGLTGLVGVLVNLGSFQILLDLGMHKFLASPVAMELSIVLNFLMHNYWTFADRVMIGRKRVRGLKYNAVSLVTLALSYGVFVGLSVLFPSASPVLLQACAIVPVVAFNYLANSYWTFHDTAPK